MCKRLSQLHNISHFAKRIHTQCTQQKKSFLCQCQCHIMPDWRDAPNWFELEDLFPIYHPTNHWSPSCFFCSLLSLLWMHAANKYFYRDDSISFLFITYIHQVFHQYVFWSDQSSMPFWWNLWFKHKIYILILTLNLTRFINIVSLSYTWTFLQHQKYVPVFT